MPWLYLKGISSGEMADTLKVLLGSGAEGFSASLVSRLAHQWNVERVQWQAQQITEPVVYVWADGVYCGLRAPVCKTLCTGADQRG